MPTPGRMRPNFARLLGLVLGAGIAIAWSSGTTLAHAACAEDCGGQIFASASFAARIARNVVDVSALAPSNTVRANHDLPAGLQVAERAPNTQPATAASDAQGTVVSQIHNAPGWRHSHTYTYRTGPYTRVVNGPGWNETSGTYNPGRTLDAYQLTSSGSCVSAGIGGPAGTGPDIVDGTCRWKYLSPVDYISLTGWTLDNRPWQAGTSYHDGDYVVSDSPLRAYEQSNPAGCTSTVAPAGTAAGSGSTFATPDGCQWIYWADILFSSERSYIPTQRYLNPQKPSAATYGLKADYVAKLWNDREYVAGEHGEAVPIRLQAHLDYTRDGFPYSPEGINIACADTCFHIVVTTAADESFADSLTQADPLTGYDPAKGVAIRNPSTSFLSDGFEARDNFVDLIGVQIKSDHGIGLGGGETHGGNDVTVRNSIVDGGRGTDAAAVNLDTSMVVANSLIIAHGAIGITEDYPGTVLHSTLVNPDRVPDSFGIKVALDWVFVGETVSNTAIFGFTHAAGSTGDPNAKDWQGMRWLGSNNATDAPPPDTGSLSLGREGTATARILPATTYGSSASAAFRAFPGDYRLAVASPLIGTGNALGPFNPACLTRKSCSPIYTFDTPDIVGTFRPEAGRDDIGAWQSCPGSAGGCRRVRLPF